MTDPESTRTGAVVRPRRWRTRLYRGLVALLALALVLFAAFAFLLLDVQRGLQSAQQRALALWAHTAQPSAELPPLEDVRALRQDLGRIERDIRWLRQSTAWLAGPPARRAEPVGRSRSRLAAWGILIDQGLTAAEHLAATAWWTALEMESSIENHGATNTASGVPLEMRADVVGSALKALSRNRGRLAEAREALARVGETSPQLGSGLGQMLASAAGNAPLAIDLLLIASDLLAEAEDFCLLIVIQNSDELRATGGFISSAAVLTIRNQGLEEVGYYNSYEVEAYHDLHPPAPLPLRQHMGAGVLLFRDGNWSPDYPATAEVLAPLFELDAGIAVDAVLAFDSAFAELVLNALGPVYVPKYEVTVSGENAVETVAAFWERPLEAPAITEGQSHSAEWYEHRKDFVGALLRASLDRLQQLSPSELLAVLDAARGGIQGKHLLFWALNDQEAQAAIRRAALDGAVQQTSGDYFMVVDSNVGWNKVDRNVLRRQDYRLTVADGGLRATLRLTYENASNVELTRCVHRAVYLDSYQEMTEQCYWNYVRVLVPRGSELRSVSGVQGFVDVGEESGKACYGALIIVPPGEETTICFDYALPTRILQEAGGQRLYQLLVQKQPGTRGTELTVQVALPAAAACTLATSTPGTPWQVVSAGDAQAGGTLDGDRLFALSWAASP